MVTERPDLDVALRDLRRAVGEAFAFPMLRRIDRLLRRWPWLYRHLS